MITSTKIYNSGNSRSVRLPKKYLDIAGWVDDQPITLSMPDNDTIIIKAEIVHIEESLEHLLSQVTDTHPVVDWGEPRGKEIW
jgi:antitoxin component of MazEF toxin-antitoxin module